MRRENIQNFIKINFFGILEVELSTEYTFAYKLKIQRKNERRFKEHCQLIFMQKKIKLDRNTHQQIKTKFIILYHIILEPLIKVTLT